MLKLPLIFGFHIYICINVLCQKPCKGYLSTELQKLKQNEKPLWGTRRYMANHQNLKLSPEVAVLNASNRTYSMALRFTQSVVQIRRAETHALPRSQQGARSRSGWRAQLKTTWGLSVYWALVQELSYHNGDL